MNIYKTIIIILFILSNFISNAFVFKVYQQNIKRCYTTQISTDKTLVARLGILRAQQRSCTIRFSVTIKDMNDQIVESLYDKIDRCQQSLVKKPETFKHTLHDDHLQEMLQVAQSYQICVEVMDNQNSEALIQVFIGQNLSPDLYNIDTTKLPLVESQEMIQMDAVTQNIKKGLIKSARHAQSIRQQGSYLDVKIAQIMSINIFITLIQIGFLITFGIIWLYLVKKLKKQ